ncbi:glycosyltransferase family 4 protein [Planctomycetota bacterium]
MKKIKVCFVATYAWALFAEQLGYPERTPFGGSEIQLYQLAKELVRDESFEVSFVVGDFGQKNLLYINGIKVYKGFKPPGYIISHLSQQAIRPPLRLGRILHRVSADIYIQRAATWVTGIIALFCKLFHKKFVYMVAHHIDVSGEYAEKNGLRGRAFDWGLKKADLVITQNKEQINLLAERYHKRICLIKTIYPVENISPVEKDSILWVGRGETWKQPKLFIQLAQQFPQERFIMICQPAVYYGAVFEQIKKQAQKISNLSFIEYVPFGEIDQYFRKAKVLVNTSDYEGFPNTFIQATKNKTPLLSFKVNPNNLINRYQCGFCAEGNFAKMVDQLKELLNNKLAWEQSSKNGFIYAREHHNLSKLMPEFKWLLNSLV